MSRQTELQMIEFSEQIGKIHGKAAWWTEGIAERFDAIMPAGKSIRDLTIREFLEIYNRYEAGENWEVKVKEPAPVHAELIDCIECGKKVPLVDLNCGGQCPKCNELERQRQVASEALAQIAREAQARIRRVTVDGHTFLCTLTDAEEAEAQKMIAEFHAAAGVGRQLELATPKLSPTQDHMVLAMSGGTLIHDVLKWALTRGHHMICIQLLKNYLFLAETRVA